MNKKGFTLVEVIATVALLAILIGLAGTSLIKKYNESKKEAIIIQEGQLVQSGDMVIQDYCKDPLSEGYQLQCDDYFRPYVDSNKNLIIEDNIYTKYICVKDLKKLGYYSEELKYSGVDCSGVVIYKIDYETDLQKDSYSVIKCGEDYTTEVENVEEYLINFKECFDTPSGGGTGEGETQVAKEYLLTVNFTELTPNGMKVGQSHSKKYKKGDSVTVPVPAYSTVANEYTPYKHGSSVNANNFNLSSDRKNLNGTMPEGNVTVNIVYSASTYVLTVNYKEFNDVQGNISFPSKQYTLYYGEEVEISHESVNNFKIISPKEFVYQMQQKDDEIDVIYQQIDFNLTYNSNGGTTCSSRKVTYNSAYGELCTPTRTGYTFDGWYLNGEKIESTDLNTNYNNITLTAKWTANKYYVVYNCNGGTPTTNYSSEHTYDETYNLANNQCEKIGSVFGGWKDSNGNTYSNKQSIKNLLSENNSSITLTAQWSPLIYYVAFAANSGSGTMSKMTVTYGHVVNLTKNAFTRTGHRFDGWSGSNGNSYSDEASITNLTTTHGVTITMTAKWTKCGAGTYLVNNVCTNCSAGYYSVGGVNSCTACEAGKYSEAGASSCLTCTSGYYCTGSSNRKKCPTGYTSVEGAIAQNKCYINVTAGKYLASANGTTFTSCDTGKYKTSHTVYYGNTSSCDTCPSGYQDGAGTTTKSNCLNNVPAGYYIKTANDINGTGCAGGYYSDTHNVKFGSTSSCTQCPSGYRDGAGCSGQSYCTISLADGQYLGTEKSTSKSTCAAGTYKAAHSVRYGYTSSCTPCPTGYTCAAGSKTISSCYISVAANKYIAQANSSTQTSCATGKHSAAHTVYYGNTSSCSWNTYTVKYNSNNGTGGSTASSSHTYGTAKELTANGFTRTNYNFNGWNTNADGTGTAYTDKQSVSNLTTANGGTVNLYAQWKPKDAENPTCTIAINSTSITLSTDDDVAVASYGLTTSATASYNKKSSVTFATGIYYGYVKDTSGKTGTCMITVEDATAKYTCSKSAIKYSTVACSSSNYGAPSAACQYYYSSNTCSRKATWAVGYSRCSYNGTNYHWASSGTEYGKESCSAQATGTCSSSNVGTTIVSSCTQLNSYNYYGSITCYSYYCNSGEGTYDSGDCVLTNQTSCPSGYSKDSTSYSCSNGTKVNTSYCYY